jgi:hypothetical protein
VGRGRWVGIASLPYLEFRAAKTQVALDEFSVVAMIFHRDVMRADAAR